MWKIITKYAGFGQYSNNSTISRPGMRGHKIKMKQHLRTQMLKTRYAFSSTSNQSKNQAGIDIIIEEERFTNLKFKTKDLQFQSDLLNALSQRNVPKTSDHQMKNRRRWYKTPRKVTTSVVGQLQTHPKQIMSANRTRRSYHQSRNQSASHRDSVFVSQNLPDRMNEYLNVLLKKKKQDFNQSLKKMEYNSVELNQSPQKINIVQPHSGRSTFYRKFKTSIKKKNQNDELKRTQINQKKVSLNDDLSFNQNFQKSQLMKRAQRLGSESPRRPLISKNFGLIQKKKRNNSYFARKKI